MWKITHTLTHPENILNAKRPVKDPAAIAKMEFLRGYAINHGLIDAREELISPTTLQKIFIWESKEKHEEFKAKWAEDLAIVRAALTAEEQDAGIVVTSDFEEQI